MMADSTAEAEGRSGRAYWGRVVKVRESDAGKLNN
jgi:hypothetical protein